MLSDSRSFTARAELTLPADAEGESAMIPVGLAMRDGRMRFDLSLSRLAGTLLEPEMVKRLESAKLDRLVFLLKSGDPARIAVPGIKSYTETVLSKDSPLHDKAGSAVGRLQKVFVANEIWDRHPCRKYRLTVEPLEGQPKSTHVAHVWEATDLANLPVRMEIKVRQGTYKLQMRDVRVMESDLRLFEIPEGYTRYEGPASLMQAAMARMAGDGKSGGSVGLLEALLGF